MITQVMTQKHLDECSSALGRPLWDFEVKILDDVLAAQHEANRKLAKLGQLGRGHSLDEVVGVFVERVKKLQTDRIVDRRFKIAKRDGRL